MEPAEKKKFRDSFVLPLLFVALLWIIELLNESFQLDLTRFGTIPLQAEGLIGIITSPLLHGSYWHLFSNSLPLIVLGALMVYFYREIIFRVFILLYLVTGFFTWVAAERNTITIGASGLIYALTCFLFFSGLLRRDRSLMTVSFLVMFLYNGLIYGIFPWLVPDHVSWQGHLSGAFAGVLGAFYFRKDGPQRQEHQWEEEEEETNLPENDSEVEIKTSQDSIYGVKYHFVEKKKENDESSATDTTPPGNP